MKADNNSGEVVARKKRKFKKEGAKKEKKDGGIKFITMKTLELLIIGGPGSGKTTLAETLLKCETRTTTALSAFDSGVGMSLRKTELDLPSGETVRLCIWDPKTSLLPKERALATAAANPTLRPVIPTRVRPRKEPVGYLSQLMSGELFEYKSDSECTDDTSSSEEEVEEDKEDVNKELAKEYLRSGTYHSAVFIFNLDNRHSIQGMKDWFACYRRLCFKTKNQASVAIVGNSRQSHLVDHVQQLLILEKNTHSPVEEDPNKLESDEVQEWVSAVNDCEEDPDDESLVRYFPVDALSGRGVAELKRWLVV